MNVLVRVLDQMNVEYRIYSDTRADIYARISISPLTLALAKESCNVISIQEHDEGLESYYMGLLGGNKYE